MHKQALIISLLLTLLPSCFAGELPNTIFGIKLHSSIDNLEGNNTSQAGMVSINGIKHQKYVMDKSIYSAPHPLERVIVSVELESRKIVSISGLSVVEPEQCQINANTIKKQVEKLYSVEFNVLKHQGDSFYLYETKEKYISIGCQSKLKTVLQYQLGRKSS